MHAPTHSVDEDVQAQATRILSNGMFPRGARAGHFMRTVGASLKFSIQARYLYVQIASLMTQTSTAKVPTTAIRNWLGGVSVRTATRVIAELTRTGPVPLLTQTPGRPGRPSVYGFVVNPWALAETQAKQAAETRAKRQPRVHAKQQQIVADAQASGLTNAATIAKLAHAGRRATWALPTRTPPAPVLDARLLRRRPTATPTH
jgi:hypothetical protein